MSDQASKIDAQQIHPVDEKLPTGRLATLGMQHVLVMYAGAVAVPLIVGRALGLDPHQVAMLISADLFCCGLVTLIQSLGFTKYFGIKLPVMMGVTFAAVGPMVAMANVQSGPEGARAIFGAIIGAGLIAIVIAPFMSRLLRFFPPVVTGTIIAIIGISLMRVGVGWAMGGPAHLAQSVDVPRLVQMVDGAKETAATAGTELTRLPGPIPMADNPNYGALDTMAVAAFVLVVILLMVRFGRGFVANIAVLLGIVIGCIVAVIMGKMHFDMVAKADWFAIVTPFAFGMPTFDPVMVLTMALVMIVVMIESVGMFLALGEITDRHITRTELAAGLRTDGLGTVIGGIFNTFPYTSFSQNVGLVGVTGVKSRWVCVAAGVIMIVLGMLPKMAALVESVPTFVLGGAGLVMFGMVAATGIRILTNVDFKGNRNNLYIVALSIGFGLVPLVAPRWTQHMAHSLHPLLESGILLTAISAVLLNMYFNGGRDDTAGAIEAAKTAEAH
ncbi:nucleobase:cation symporter-2 family protein [Thauera sp.]|uniref:nucleobase:cation symporter-2 family protein n=1 Tax=Thauera sp. TaxID=1905334 RepID=UPI0039E5D307